MRCSKKLYIIFKAFKEVVFYTCTAGGRVCGGWAVRAADGRVGGGLAGVLWTDVCAAGGRAVVRLCIQLALKFRFPLFTFSLERERERERGRERERKLRHNNAF